MTVSRMPSFYGSLFLLSPLGLFKWLHVQPIILVLLAVCMSWCVGDARLLAEAPSPSPAAASVDVCQNPSPYLEMFVDPLPFPLSINASNGQPLTIGAYKITQKLHRDLPNTTLYAFGTSQESATFPGPTLVARRYVPTHIRWTNYIPDEHHMFPRGSDSVPWANPSVPIVVHHHGMEAPSIYDGNPDAWFTPKNETGPAFVTRDYVYPNTQTPTSLWYHDHALGITRLNVLAGLSGLYFLTSDEEDAVIPTIGAPLVFKDWRFYANGSIDLPGPGISLPVDWCPEWYDTWLVNGKVWPYVQVYPRPYRFRLLNACNARFVAMRFSNNLTITQIGTDGGLLSEPLYLTTLLISTGERADIIVDFSELAYGEEFLLTNLPVEPNSRELPYIGPQTSVIMKFVVVQKGGIQEGAINDPTFMQKISSILPALTGGGRLIQMQFLVDDLTTTTPLVRTITMDPHYNSEGSTYQYTLNNLTWDDPVTVIPTVGSTEIWEIINLSFVPHPFHIHLIQYQVINQQSILVDEYNQGTCSVKIPYPQNGTCFTEHPHEPETYQQGWKDNVIVSNATMLRVLLRFTTREGNPFSFDPTVGPGYVYHCHVVQHEDHSMMRPFRLQYKVEKGLVDLSLVGHIMSSN